jgi:hypothetical protein
METRALLERLGAWENSQAVFPEDSYEAGLRAFRRATTRVRAAICASDAVREAHAASDEAALVAAIADLVAQHYATPPCVTIAVLAYRVGIARLCSGLWMEDT